MNRHQFEQTAKKFRAGRITLDKFADLVFNKEDAKSSKTSTAESPPPSEFASPLPFRKKDSHKGDFGRVLTIGGSRGMAGAISLTSMAALRCGSGMVTAAVPESQQSTVAGFSPCLMTVGVVESKGRFSKDGIDTLLERCDWADVVAIGPGLGCSKGLQKIVRLLYNQLPQAMVVDADALNNLAMDKCDLSDHEGVRVMTPHEGELQRLLRSNEKLGRQQLESQAILLAAESNVVMVAKGGDTLVTDGQQIYRNKSGNPGMASAGSGDVLTGVIASLIGQGLDAFEAAKFGTNVHGLAGDLAVAELGQASLVATDLIDFLPDALQC